MINDVIRSIIVNQTNNLNFDYNDDIKSNVETISVLINNSSVAFTVHDNANHGIKQRLLMITPYIQTYARLYNPQNFEFKLFLGDKLHLCDNVPPILCFAKDIEMHNGILIPNIDFLNFSMSKHLSNSINDIIFTNKQHSSIFIGASTGDFINNTRALYCQKILNHDRHYGYINNLCQNTYNNWIGEYPFISQCLHKSMSLKQQMQHKILINIDGNTLCYSRLYWQICSNSIPVYINKDRWISFFDLIDNSNTYISCSLEESISVLDKILDEYSQDQIDQINYFGKEYYNTAFREYHSNPAKTMQTIMNLTLDNLYNML